MANGTSVLFSSTFHHHPFCLIFFFICLRFFLLLSFLNLPSIFDASTLNSHNARPHRYRAILYTLITRNKDLCHPPASEFHGSLDRFHSSQPLASTFDKLGQLGAFIKRPVFQDSTLSSFSYAMHYLQ